MSDLLVKLYELPDPQPAMAKVRATGVEIRLARATEGPFIAAWVQENSNASWGRACAVATQRDPISCFIAVEADAAHVPEHPYDLRPETLLGFACYDVDVRGTFGPIGVHPDRQEAGIGTALLLQSLHAMARDSYAYAVIGWAGPVDWYARTVGATVIEGSEPSYYRGPLR